MATTARQEAPMVPLAPYAVDTLTKLFHHAAEKYDRPDALLRHTADGWQPISHRSVTTRVERIAAGLQDLGIGPGHHVAILSENRAEWMMCDFAVLFLGAADVPVYTTL